MHTRELTALMNEDLALTYRAMVQTIRNLSGAPAADYHHVQLERITYLERQVAHAAELGRQVQFLGGTPSTLVPPVHVSPQTRDALNEELALETLRLTRFRRRIREARLAGVPHVAAAVEQILVETQRQVQLLQATLEASNEIHKPH